MQRQDETFPARVQRKFKNLIDQQRFCDFKVICEGREFRTHKVILAANSRYFEVMLLNDTKEARENEVTLLNYVSADSFEAILDFMYTSQIELSNENVQDNFIAAAYIQLDEVRDLCVKYISERVDITNCLSVLSIAEHYKLSELFINVFSFCLKNFERVLVQKEFLELEENLLGKILTSSNLDVENEEVVYKALMSWVNADLYNRVSNLDKLLAHVRLPLMDPITLISLSRHHLIKQSNKCRDLIDEAKDYILLQNYPDKRSEMTGLRFKPRISQRQSRIYALGGWSHGYLSIASVEKYDPFKDVWVDVKSMTRPRCGVGATILDNMLYAVGGHDGQNYLDSAERYDIKADCWLNDIPNMKIERTSVAVVSLDGYVYAIGGQSGFGPTNVVERYNPSIGRWEECHPMIVERLGAGAAVHSNLIYVIGGANNSVLNSGEFYNPATDSWTMIPSMSIGRKHLGCTAYGGKIYVVGGRGDKSELDSGEVFDPSTQEWESIPSMTSKRSGLGLVELCDKLYAVGGHNGDVRLKRVEEYDLKEKHWTAKSSMKFERLGGGLAVHLLSCPETISKR